MVCAWGHVQITAVLLISLKEDRKLWILMLDLRYMKSFSRAVNTNRLKKEKWHTVDFR